jgi:hypothetical protein
MSARVFRTVLGIATLLSVACERHTPMAGIDTEQPKPVLQPQRGIYLSVSSLMPSAGDTVIVAATLAEDSIALGSFKVRLAFDAARMQYVGDAPVGGMRVVNPSREEVVVVGASSGGAEHRLFELRFRMTDPKGLQSMLLKIDELNDASFTNRAREIAQPSALVVDATLAGSGESVSSAAGAKPSGVKDASRAPVIDSISPRSGEVDAERVTDIVLYGRGFAPSGNVVTFGGAEVRGLLSEAGGTVIRFAAPTQLPTRQPGVSRRVTPGVVDVRVKNGVGRSNAATFTVRAER